MIEVHGDFTNKKNRLLLNDLPETSALFIDPLWDDSRVPFCFKNKNFWQMMLPIISFSKHYVRAPCKTIRTLVNNGYKQAVNC